MSSKIMVGKLFVDMQQPGTILTEEDTKTGDIYLVGPFAQSDILNNNRRVYPEEILDRSMNDFIKEMIETDSAVSELGHPDSPKINLDKICCKIVSLEKQEKNWMGKAKILPTPSGEILKGLVLGGVRTGMSTRGLGSANSTRFKNEDCNLVDNFNLRAIDTVHSPSGPDCYVDAITEAKDWILDNTSGKIYELNEESYKRFEREINNLPVRSEPKQDHMYKAIKNFLNGLRSNTK